MATLGWIGLGGIGMPMALRHLAAGHELRVWGRTSAKLAPALERGARAAASAAELAETCEAVFLCVTDHEAVAQVVFGADGIAARGGAGTLLVDHSTIHPERTRELGARLLAACGMRWVDAPVSGGAAGARAGTLTILVGGEQSDVERARPWLRSYGERITHLGPLGTGQAAKSCSQAVFATTIATWIEVLRYARALGLAPRTLLAALQGSWSDSPVRQFIAPHLERAATMGGNGLLIKDLEIVLDLARAVAVDLPLTARAAQLLEDAAPPTKPKDD